MRRLSRQQRDARSEDEIPWPLRGLSESGEMPRPRHLDGASDAPRGAAHRGSRRTGALDPKVVGREETIRWGRVRMGASGPAPDHKTSAERRRRGDAVGASPRGTHQERYGTATHYPITSEERTTAEIGTRPDGTSTKVTSVRRPDGSRSVEVETTDVRGRILKKERTTVRPPPPDGSKEVAEGGAARCRDSGAVRAERGGRGGQRGRGPPGAARQHREEDETPSERLMKEHPQEHGTRALRREEKGLGEPKDAAGTPLKQSMTHQTPWGQAGFEGRSSPAEVRLTSIRDSGICEPNLSFEDGEIIEVSKVSPSDNYAQSRSFEGIVLSTNDEVNVKGMKPFNDEMQHMYEAVSGDYVSDSLHAELGSNDSLASGEDEDLYPCSSPGAGLHRIPSYFSQSLHEQAPEDGEGMPPNYDALPRNAEGTVPSSGEEMQYDTAVAGHAPGSLCAELDSNDSLASGEDINQAPSPSPCARDPCSPSYFICNDPQKQAHGMETGLEGEGASVVKTRLAGIRDNINEPPFPVEGEVSPNASVHAEGMDDDGVRANTRAVSTLQSDQSHFAVPVAELAPPEEDIEDEVERRIQERLSNPIGPERVTIAQVVGPDDGEGADGENDPRGIGTWAMRHWVWPLSIILLVGAILGISVGLTQRNNGHGTHSDMYKPMLETLVQRGVLRCGVKEYKLGFSTTNEKSGEKEGFEIDLCRAVAAAALGPSYRMEVVPVARAGRFVSLEDGSIDLLVASTTHTFERDVYQVSAKTGFSFSVPYIYEGLSFGGIPEFVECAENLTTTGDCSDLKICVFDSTTWIDFLGSLLPQRAIFAVPGTGTWNEHYDALKYGTCNVIAGEQFDIAEEFVRNNGYSGPYQVGNKMMSKEPLAFVTRDNDYEWSSFVDWVLQGLLEAEVQNVTKRTASQFADADFFGNQFKNMFRDALDAVGNYGELYTRNLERFIPRHQINFPNRGKTGLVYSHPYGQLQTTGPGPVEGGKLAKIMQRGYLRCGITNRRRDGSTLGWASLDMDFCHALSASIFKGKFDSVVFEEFLEPESSFESLADGGIDVLSGGSMDFTQDVRTFASRKGFSHSQPCLYNQFGGKHAIFALISQHEDVQWSAFIYWVVMSTFYAEENAISQTSSIEMPLVNLFGPQFSTMFRDAVAVVGNYGEMYERNVEENIPRGNRNLLNVDPFGPQHCPIPLS